MKSTSLDQYAEFIEKANWLRNKVLDIVGVTKQIHEWRSAKVAFSHIAG